MTDLDFTSFAEQARMVAAGEVTSAELVEHCLARIHRLDQRLNAFAYVLDDAARAEAAARDATPADQRGPLHGVPIAIKDENDVAGLPTAYGGAAFTTPAAADSEVVRRRSAGTAVARSGCRPPSAGCTASNASAAGPVPPPTPTCGARWE